MFVTRLISGAVLVALALLFNIVGGDLLLAVCFVISEIGLFELFRALDREKDLLAVIGYIAAAAYYGILRFWGEEEVLLAILGCMILMLAVYVLRFPHYRALEVMSSVFCVIYCPVMLSFIYRTRSLAGGAFLVWLIFIAAWGCDTCAYCAGRLFGKHKLAPVLSPKKSIEGAIGGVIGAALLGFLYALFLVKKEGTHAGLWEYALICALGAVISQIGDLAASGIKRDHKIKDYGKLIPGHGGIMDRFDSVIFTAPIIYYLGTIFLH